MIGQFRLLIILKHHDPMSMLFKIDHRKLHLSCLFASYFGKLFTFTCYSLIITKIQEICIRVERHFKFPHFSQNFGVEIMLEGFYYSRMPIHSRYIEDFLVHSQNTRNLGNAFASTSMKIYSKHSHSHLQQ